MRFDVLSSKTKISGSHFLEASAGTGKTFAIEHLYARFILEYHLNIQDILVVTFTKLATRELKNRIYSNLKFLINNFYQDEYLPDYLLELKKTSDVKQLYKSLKKNLTKFHHHAISTIHGFCVKILNLYLPGQILNDEKRYSFQYLTKEIRTYLNEEHYRSFLPPNLLKILSKKYPESYGFQFSLEDVLIKGIISKNFDQENDPLKESNQIQNLISNLRKNFNYSTPEDIFNNLEPNLGFFKGTTSSNCKAVLKNFSEFFFHNSIEILEDDTICFFDRYNMKKNTNPSNLSHFLTQLHENKFFYLIKELFNCDNMLLKVCRDIKSRIQNKDLILTENDLLTTTEALLKNDPSTTKKITEQFPCIMIDEFQDTDSIQWNIFSSLFSASTTQKHIFLIGDPKQSIYRFRSSDVYKYNEAKEDFQKKGTVSCLDVNYRSTPILMETLNFLFSHAAPLMVLPRIEKTIPYHSLKTVEGISNDHFESPCVLIKDKDTEEDVFKQICHEAAFLNMEKSIPYKNMAILFKDRKQMLSFTKLCKLPTTMHSTTKLSESPVLEILITILEAILSPYDEQKLHKALLTPVFSIPFQELGIRKIEFIEMFTGYNLTLKNLGILSFFHELIKTWGANLIGRIHHNFYHDLENICDTLNSQISSPSHYLLQLKLMQNQIQDDAIKTSASTNSQIDALQLMTIHASKGLEYDIVFTPGLDKANRNKSSLSEMEQKEEDAEQMRKIYVALTRAKKYLFISLTKKSYLSIEKDTPKTPISIFLNEIRKNTGLAIDKLTLNKRPLFGCSQNSDSTYENAKKDLPSLIEPKIFSLSLSKDPKVLSFSSYKKDRKQKNSAILEKLEINAFDLPSIPIGKETGHILHKILEKINFDLFKKIDSEENLISYIRPFLKDSCLENKEKLIANMLEKTFNTPISVDDQTFKLKEISSQKLFRETEFYCYNPSFSFSSIPYWKGTIDVFLEHNDYYYVIDWKTTYLGPSYEDYNISSLRLAIQDDLLDKQAEIYKEACFRYLKCFQKEERFKGVIFIFLRGFNKENQGIIIY